MKAIMISIKPKWVAKILNGEKTIEIRKTMPKCDLPIDVYIYCTKDKQGLWLSNGKYDLLNENKYVKSLINGKVVAKFTLNKVEKFDLIEEQKYKGNNNDDILKYNECIRKQREIAKCSCLTICDLVCYCDTKALGINQKEMVGYAWHIDNLLIFDEPRELSEFYKLGHYKDLDDYFTDEKQINGKWCIPIKKAPQSWCYVESEE